MFEHVSALNILNTYGTESIQNYFSKGVDYDVHLLSVFGLQYTFDLFSPWETQIYSDKN